MLVIRQEQIDALSHASKERFFDKLEVHCRDHWQSKIAGQTIKQLRSSLKIIVNRAELYGISTEADLVRFVNLTFVWGMKFDITEPWAATILQDDVLGGPAKVRKLRDVTEVKLKSG